MAGENAAASAAGESAQSNSSGGEGQGQDGGVVDFGEILAQHQSELARTGKTVEALRGELAKRDTQFDRVRKAFSGDDGEKLTPRQQRMQHFDALAAEMEQVSKDHGLPLTTKIGKEFATATKEMMAENDSLRQELDQIKESIKRQQNPAFQGLERAAFIMEGMVEDALGQMYGQEDGSRPIRAAQFNAVTARINEEIKDLMKNDPDTLLKVQRNPKVMRNMVNHFMAEMLPPKVRGMMEDEQIRNTPMSQQELWQAFSEARDGYNSATEGGRKKEAEHFSNLITDLRREILSNQISGRKGGTPDKPSLNSLMSQVYGMAGGK